MLPRKRPRQQAGEPAAGSQAKAAKITAGSSARQPEVIDLTQSDEAPSATAWAADEEVVDLAPANEPEIQYELYGTNSVSPPPLPSVCSCPTNSSNRQQDCWVAVLQWLCHHRRESSCQARAEQPGRPLLPSAIRSRANWTNDPLLRSMTPTRCASTMSRGSKSAISLAKLLRSLHHTW